MKKILIFCRWRMSMAYISEAWLGAVRLSARVIGDDQGIMSRGPPCGAVVVTAGAAELFGIKFGVGSYYKRRF
jgi:hypothetical protein